MYVVILVYYLFGSTDVIFFLCALNRKIIISQGLYTCMCVYVYMCVCVYVCVCVCVCVCVKTAEMGGRVYHLETWFFKYKVGT